MNIRAQVSSVFHLDKCIGCHTCSIACKNLWTDRKGAEYMWWNNVETKPGPGYPRYWEDNGGGWNEERFMGFAEKLLQSVKAAGLEVVGEVQFARFDPPWKPGFLKHNEVLVEVNL